MQDLIQVWRNEFCSWFNVTHGFYHFYVMDGNKYQSNEVELCWQSWLAAKQSRTVIELPEPDHYYQENEEYDADFVNVAITVAGYQYKIKGE